LPRDKENRRLKKSNKFTSNRVNCTAARKSLKCYNRKGIQISQKMVARWMKEEGIRSKTKKKHKPTNSSTHQLPTPTYWNNSFMPKSPINMVGGHYVHWDARGVALSLQHHGLFSQRNVGWVISERMNRQLVIQGAVRKRQSPPGLIHHSDQGSQICFSRLSAMLREYGMKQA
jgi:putative transposase